MEDKVPAEGFLGRFTIRSDVGAFEAHSLEMLKIRIAELAALEQLEVASKTETFLTALGSAAERFASRPVETVQGIPSGVERFFGRVKRGGESTIAGVTAPGVSSTDKAEALSRRIGGITVDALGYEQERRQLAIQLQVDPYTTNPVLSQKLDEFARVAFSGRVEVNAVISVVVPAPLNFVAWTARTAEFAKRSDLKAQERHVWLTGQMSPRAQKEMTKLG